MSNLVKRLRVPRQWYGVYMAQEGEIPVDGQLLNDAADEIERLDAAWSNCSRACARVQGERDAARAEIERLRAENEQLRVDIRAGDDSWHEREDEVAELKAEFERWQADAARYRWLRDVDDDPYNLKSMWYVGDGGADAVDAAIDAAMKKKQERK